MVPIPSSSYVGSAISIGGNVLIAFALNTQKLAHEKINNKQPVASTSARKTDERTPLLRSRSRSPTKTKRARHSHLQQGDLHVYTLAPETNTITDEVPNPTKAIRELAKDNAEVEQRDGRSGRVRKKWLSIRSASREREGSDIMSSPPRMKRGDSVRSQMSRQRSDSKTHSTRSKGRKQRSRSTQSGANVYTSKLWWLGILLMALGELGNFTSYAFAPASIVAPLGTVALIANCFIAPCLLNEKFRKKDLIGIALSILGAIGVVLSGRSQNQSLSPKQFLLAIKTPAFIVYSSISLGLIIFLMVLSRTRAGDKYLAVDILITALCGGFTVLSTKAFSGFITKDFVDAFKQPVTYPVLAVLASTAVLQIIYINKALQRFESRVVVPTQFVSFTISAITGSAILYRDFENLDATRVALFFTGSAAVFAGVILLTRQQETSHSGYSDIKDADGQEDDVQGNESSISASSIGDLDIDGVTLTSRPPTDIAAQQQNGLSPSPAKPQVRKLRSFGNFPAMPRSSTTPGLAVISTVPLRTGRPPSIATTRMFSPGYILIAGGGGFASMDVDRDSDDLEASRSGSEEGDGESRDDQPILGEIEEGNEPDTADHSLANSQTMRRSETV